MLENAEGHAGTLTFTSYLIEGRDLKFSVWDYFLCGFFTHNKCLCSFHDHSMFACGWYSLSA